MISTSALIEKFQKALDEKWGYIWGTAGILWTQARQKQKVDYMVNKYGTSWKKNSEAKDDDYYGAAMYGDKWIGSTVADCSGLFRWAFNTFKTYIAHGSNTIFLDYCTNKGKLSGGRRTDGKTLRPGTAVFVYKDSMRKYTHIGLYIGGSKVIEASGTIAGVCMSNVSANKWTHWGELKNVSYEDSGFPSDTGWRPTLRKGSKGEEVKEAQTLLYNLGYNLGPCGIDGDFGRATQAAVIEFQKNNKLTQDGVIGPMTWDALQKASKGSNSTSDSETTLYTVSIHHLDRTQAEALRNNYPGSTITVEKE